MSQLKTAASRPVPGIGVKEPPNRNGAFPRLNAEQRERIRAVGTLREVERG